MRSKNKENIRMPNKTDITTSQNTSRKEFVTVIDKQIAKLKTKDPKCTKKQSTKSPAMVKEAPDCTKSKTPKQQKLNITQQEEKQNTPTTKRNASERSPLEGHLEKKQRDKAEINSDKEYDQETPDPNNKAQPQQEASNNPTEKNTESVTTSVNERIK